MESVSGSLARERWFAVGSSADPDGFRAGSEAATGAGRAREAKLLVVFCSDDYDLEALLAGIAQEAPDVPLIGCSTAGEIATAGPADSSVVVVAFGGDGFSVATGVGRDASQDLLGAGASAAACLGDVDERP